MIVLFVRLKINDWIYWLTLGACCLPNDIDTLDITGGGGQTNSSASDDSMHNEQSIVLIHFHFI